MSKTTELIRSLIAKGLSQIEISRRTGIPQPRLSRWQGGETPAGADDALKLAALDRELSALSVPAEAIESTAQAQAAIAP